MPKLARYAYTNVARFISERKEGRKEVPRRARITQLPHNGLIMTAFYIDDDAENVNSRNKIAGPRKCATQST